MTSVQTYFIMVKGFLNQAKSFGLISNDEYELIRFAATQDPPIPAQVCADAIHDARVELAQPIHINEADVLAALDIPQKGVNMTAGRYGSVYEMARQGGIVDERFTDGEKK